MYTAALEASPDSVDLATSLGLLYMKMGDNQKALEQFGSALAHDPDCPKALLATGLIMQNHREYDVGLSKYRALSCFIPESAPLWNNIGMCFFGKKKLVAAISCLKRANYLAPLDWKILYNLGLVHISSQQYASAFHFMTSALNLQPKIGCVFLPLAITLTHLNDLKNARYAFEQVIGLSPDDPLCFLNYSLFLYKQSEISQAVEEYKKFQVLAQRVSGLDINVLKVASTLRQVLKVNPSQTKGQGEEMLKGILYIDSDQTNVSAPSNNRTKQNAPYLQAEKEKEDSKANLFENQSNLGCRVNEDNLKSIEGSTFDKGSTKQNS